MADILIWVMTDIDTCSLIYYDHDLILYPHLGIQDCNDNCFANCLHAAAISGSETNQTSRSGVIFILSQLTIQHQQQLVN